ncbi:MAG: nitrilase-related carbon-nitrogen hydrolase [Bacillota bacterium]
MEVRVALIQHRAYDVDNSSQGLDAVLSLLEHAGRSGIDLAVLPECSFPGYYLGLRGNPHKAAEGWERALGAFRDVARRRKFNLVAGIAEEDGAKLYNSAFLIGRDGTILGRARKTFLWHFDEKWFSPGDEYRVHETDIGKIGMIVCADGRLPEISRTLALKGADIIADPTNWVTTGNDPARLSNPQVEYMMPARAVENGVWLACANKVGREADSVVYCGHSLVVSPSGEVVKEGSPDKEEIVTATMDVKPGSRDKAMKERAAFYSPGFSILSEPNESAPLSKLVATPIVPSETQIHVAIVQLDRDASLQDFLQESPALVTRLAQQGNDLIIFPEIPCSVMRDFGSHVREALRPLAAVLGVHVAVVSHARPHNATTVFDPRGNSIVYAGNEDLLDIRGVKVGFMRGRQGFIPEVARTLFLKGADLIAWQADLGTGLERKVCVTRALENRVYVALANCSSKDPCRNSMVVSPDRVLAETFPSCKQAVTAQVSAAVSRIKRLVRGTDVFLDRKPELYETLTRA